MVQAYAIVACSAAMLLAVAYPYEALDERSRHDLAYGYTAADALAGANALATLLVVSMMADPSEGNPEEGDPDAVTTVAWASKLAPRGDESNDLLLLSVCIAQAAATTLFMVFTYVDVRKWRKWDMSSLDIILGPAVRPVGPAATPRSGTKRPDATQECARVLLWLALVLLVVAQWINCTPRHKSAWYTCSAFVGLAVVAAFVWRFPMLVATPPRVAILGMAMVAVQLLCTDCCRQLDSRQAVNDNNNTLRTLSYEATTMTTAAWGSKCPVVVEVAATAAWAAKLSPNVAAATRIQAAARGRAARRHQLARETTTHAWSGKVPTINAISLSDVSFSFVDNEAEDEDEDENEGHFNIHWYEKEEQIKNVNLINDQMAGLTGPLLRDIKSMNNLELKRNLWLGRTDFQDANAPYVTDYSEVFSFLKRMTHLHLVGITADGNCGAYAASFANMFYGLVTNGNFPDHRIVRDGSPPQWRSKPEQNLKDLNPQEVTDLLTAPDAFPVISVRKNFIDNSFELEIVQTLSDPKTKGLILLLLPGEELSDGHYVVALKSPDFFTPLQGDTLIHVWLDQFPTGVSCQQPTPKWSGFSSTLWYHDGTKCKVIPAHSQRDIHEIIRDIKDEHLNQVFMDSFSNDVTTFYLKIDLAKLLAAWDALNDHFTVVVSDIDALVPGDAEIFDEDEYINVQGGIERLTREALLPYFETAKRFGMVMTRFRRTENENGLVIFHKSIRDTLLEVGIKLAAKSIVNDPDNVHTVLNMHTMMFKWHMFTKFRLGWVVDSEPVLTHAQWTSGGRQSLFDVMQNQGIDLTQRSRISTSVSLGVGDAVKVESIDETDTNKVVVDSVSACYVGATLIQKYQKDVQKGFRSEIVAINGTTLTLETPVPEGTQSLRVKYEKSPWVPVVFQKSQFSKEEY